MTNQYVIEINGFEFTVTSGDSFQGDGITIRNGSADFDNPLYLLALRRAVEVYPYLYARDYLEEFVVQQRLGQRRQIPDSMLDRCVEYVRLLRSPERPADLVQIEEPMWEAMAWVENTLAGRQAKERKAVRRQEPQPGYVYILRSEVGDRKIGRTNQPANRLHTFAVKLPFRVEYELVIRSDDARKLEQALHEEFQLKHIDGEWYALTDADVAELRIRFEGSLWGG